MSESEIRESARTDPVASIAGSLSSGAHSRDPLAHPAALSDKETGFQFLEFCAIFSR
jgi:hypothetical protein